MAFNFKSISIRKIAIVGAGQIGPDIGMHFATQLARNDVSIIIIDISSEAIQRAELRIHNKLQKALEKGILKEAQVTLIRQSLTFTTDYEALIGVDIVLEAATEDADIKDAIFRRVEALTSPETLFLSNSSHMEPEVIFRNINDKSRCLVAHYFFPADINPIVEVVPSAMTHPEWTLWLMAFYEAIGKVPIKVKSAYGYAIDPVFEGLCQVAIQARERGWGDEKMIDAAAVQALGLGVGPFTALNLTGGNPITAHGLDELGVKVHHWFRTPALLHEKNKRKEAWMTAQRGEEVTLDEKLASRLIPYFQGAYFTLAGMIMDASIVDASDFNMACEMALVIRPPLAMMESFGGDKTLELVKEFCTLEGLSTIPNSIAAFQKNDGWELKDITTQIYRNCGIITIRRPKVLNALNLKVLGQIVQALKAFQVDETVQAIIITGLGRKVFAAGADIRDLDGLCTPKEAEEHSRRFQGFLDQIAGSGKPVIAALNGFAFGGGNELAIACHARLARKDISTLFGQPEVNLGFIPGAGGTQRLPRVVGLEQAARLLRTGATVSVQEALDMGYLHAIAEGDLLEEAVNLALDIVQGKVRIVDMPTRSLNGDAEPASLDLGHLSRRIDQLLVQSIYEGWRLTLHEGLQLESRIFGLCLLTEDMRIGLDNFKKNGSRQKAPFIHQ